MSALWLLVLLLPSAADAAVFRVGAGAGCTHATLADALAASAANGPGIDSILLVNDHAYLQQAVLIDRQTVVLRGGLADCAATTAMATTTLDGAGNGGQPIVRITNDDDTSRLVVLQDIVLHGGDAGAGDGGALSIAGRLQVDLVRVQLVGNRATRGGALYAVGTSATRQAQVSISEGTPPSPSVVEGNAAQAGGAAWIGRWAALGLGGVFVRDNSAVDGGAVYLGGGNLQLQTAPEPDGAPGRGLTGNVASRDGGAVFAGEGGRIDAAPFVRHARFRVQDNTAGRDGGAFHLEGVGTLLFGSALWLLDNVAGGRGGAIHAIGRSGVVLRGGDPGDPAANDCDTPGDCLRVAGNRAGGAGGLGQGGAVFAEDSSLYAAYGLWADNRASEGGLAVVLGSTVEARVDGVLATDGGGAGSLLVAGSGARLTLHGTTLAAAGGSAPLVDVRGGGFSASNSIVWAPGRAALVALAGDPVETTCVVAHEDFHPAGDVRVADPGFADPGQGDYTPAVDGAATDACASDGVDVDARLRRRGADTGMPGGQAADLFDAGAIERQPVLLVDGFEGAAR